MAKSRRTIKTVLPTYRRDQSQWRKNILTNVLNAANKRGVRYDTDDRLEVVVLLYLSEGKRLDIHDVDNRLKDILDALQGRFGSVRTKRRLIKNDNQIWRVVIEKQAIPKMFGDNAGGYLMIRPYKARRWPLQVIKGDHLAKESKRAPLPPASSSSLS
jgi:Holliday junction resolvase RusA-like endonuclease